MMSHFHIICVLLQIICTTKLQQHNSLSYCMNSNQILLIDKDQLVHVMGCILGMKFAIYDCTVTHLLSLLIADFELHWWLSGQHVRLVFDRHCCK